MLDVEDFTVHLLPSDSLLFVEENHLLRFKCVKCGMTILPGTRQVADFWVSEVVPHECEAIVIE